jgi:hypothetical protein
MGATHERVALKGTKPRKGWEEMPVMRWLDEESADGWFPEDCELVPDLTSLILGAAVAVVAVLVVVVRPMRRSPAGHRLTQRATQSIAAVAANGHAR